MIKVVVVMPAYDEGEGIPGFLQEIEAAFVSDVQLVVCDDCSTDDTVARVQALQATGLHVRVVPGTTNVGHGPTTLRALREGLDSGADVVVAVDGDGQFKGSDVARVADLVIGGVDVAEGVRTHRREPLFRRVTAF